MPNYSALLVTDVVFGVQADYDSDIEYLFRWCAEPTPMHVGDIKLWSNESRWYYHAMSENPLCCWLYTCLFWGRLQSAVCRSCGSWAAILGAAFGLPLYRSRYSTQCKGVQLETAVSLLLRSCICTSQPTVNLDATLQSTTSQNYTTLLCRFFRNCGPFRNINEEKKSFNVNRKLRVSGWRQPHPALWLSTRGQNPAITRYNFILRWACTYQVVMDLFTGVLFYSLWIANSLFPFPLFLFNPIWKANGPLYSAGR